MQSSNESSSIVDDDDVVDMMEIDFVMLCVCVLYDMRVLFFLLNSRNDDEGDAKRCLCYAMLCYDAVVIVAAGSQWMTGVVVVVVVDG
mmetsp:Transcript_46803/g.114106  ORF Transcript_46803/g.114106 Transcript_46803/m.114106 type:complete len:88 (-) Transcript_46803:21-284(-)